MTSKVLKASGQIIYTSTYRALTDDEIANPGEVKAHQAFDAAVSAKLGAAMSKHDLPSEDIDVDTPTFVPYEDDENPPFWLPEIDEVTPEVADSYVGAQVNFPIRGTTSKAESSVMHGTPMGTFRARLTSTPYSTRRHMKWSFQMDELSSSVPTRLLSICLLSVTRKGTNTYFWTQSSITRSMTLPSLIEIDISMSMAINTIGRPHVESSCAYNGRMAPQHGND